VSCASAFLAHCVVDGTQLERLRPCVCFVCVCVLSVCFCVCKWAYFCVCVNFSASVSASISVCFNVCVTNNGLEWKGRDTRGRERVCGDYTVLCRIT
jgi:hypothetical protein